MQAWSLTLDKILTHAGERCAARPVVSREASGAVRVSDYGEVLAAARRFSAALVAHGVGRGDRVATMMWNDFDHLAAWYGAMGIGAVVHTLNPRLHPDQIAWIARHGGARVLVIEEEFRPLVEGMIDRLASVELVVVSASEAQARSVGGRPTQTFSRFLATDASVAWGGFDEETAAGLCYTSGTTGDPKGVLYSHRSNFLHALSINQPNGLAVGANDVVLPVVPMFHANAWGLAFVAPMAGAELVLPGRRLDGASLAELIASRGVTVAVGVPTVWEELLRHLRGSGARLPSLRRVVVGGSAAPPATVHALQEQGVEVVHAWGMTEMSPLGTITTTVPDQPGDDVYARFARVLRQGGALFPVEVEIFDEGDRPCAHDDGATGALRARGPTVVREYYGAGTSALDEAGWFDTGDVAAIDAAGSVRIVDRAKDVIKSGGEWISSIELENLAATHPAVKRAAVVGIADERWGERPLLVMEVADAGVPTPEDMIEHLRTSVPKWWLPSHFAWCSIPIGATGKIDKMALRRLLNSAQAPSIVSWAEASGKLVPKSSVAGEVG